MHTLASEALPIALSALRIARARTALQVRPNQKRLSPKEVRAGFSLRASSVCGRRGHPGALRRRPPPIEGSTGATLRHTPASRGWLPDLVRWWGLPTCGARSHARPGQVMEALAKLIEEESGTSQPGQPQPTSKPNDVSIRSRHPARARVSVCL